MTNPEARKRNQAAQTPQQPHQQPNSPALDSGVHDIYCEGGRCRCFSVVDSEDVGTIPALDSGAIGRLTEAERTQHVIRWTYEGDHVVTTAICLAASDADCRLEAVDHNECQCEYWGRIERRDDGTIWHALTDGHRDLRLPRDEDQWHQVKPSELPAESGCNVVLSINESGCAEELTPDGEHHEFVIADVPFEPVWENDYCSWRPKPTDLAAIVREHTERAWDEAIDHVWELSDPVSTIDHAEDPPVCTVFDMRQAKRENPYRAARQEQGR